MKKIDIYFNGSYQGSTNAVKTCREAKDRFLENQKRVLLNNSNYSPSLQIASRDILANPSLVKCYFDKK